MRTTFNHQPPRPDGGAGRTRGGRAARQEVERREAALVRRARNKGIVREQIAHAVAIEDEA